MEIDWTRVDERQFEKLCGDLIRLSLPPEHQTAYCPESMPHQSDFQKDGIIKDYKFGRLKPPIFFSFKTSDPRKSSADASKTITRELLKPKNKVALLSGKPKSVVLWANHNFRPRDKKKIEDALHGVRVEIEGRDQLEYRLLQQPFLLTKYFGWSSYVSCWHSGDRSALRDALGLKDPLANSVPLEGVRHPLHKKVGNPSGKRLRIVGVPGCGKSFFLYQLLAAFEDAEVVILKSLELTEVADHLRQLRHSACRPLVIVVDNLHDQIGKLQHFTEVLDILLSQPKRRELPVTVLITHWSSKRLEIERDVPHRHWESWRFDEINLDNPPQNFICEVVKTACDHLKIDAEEGMRDAFVREIIGWENTPACAVASLWPYRGKSLKSEHGFHPVMLKVRDKAWRYLFEELQKEGIPEYAILLRSLSVLRWCGRPKPDVASVWEIATQVGGASESSLDYALERLESAGWIQREGDTLHSHDLQIFPPTVGLHEEGIPSPFLERFSEMVIKDGLPCIRSDRVTVLHHLGQMFWNMELAEKSVEFNDAILRVAPNDVRALCNRGVALVKIKKTDEGLQDLHHAVSLSPAELDPSRILYHVYRRANQTEKAMGVLQALGSNWSRDANDMGFLAQAYADLKDTKRALICAKQFASSHPNEPEPYAVLAQVQWLAGKKKQSLKTVDMGLTFFPEDGLLLFVKADIESQSNRPAVDENTLLLVEKALAARPNNPSIYALAAWLHILAGHHDKAYEVAETGVELFKFWPDLLVVRGITLERKGELQEAHRILQKAVENIEMLSGWYRPNLFLALGMVCLRIGDDVAADDWFKRVEQEGMPQERILAARAYALRKAGKVNEAIVVQEQVVTINGTSAEEWVELADLYMLLEHTEDAIKTLRKAISLSPDNEEILNRLGFILSEVEHHQDAVDVLRKVVSLNPRNGKAWYRLGKSLYALSRYEDAARAFELAAANGDTALGTQLLYGFTLKSLGRYKETLKLCRKLKSHSDNNGRFQLLEAECLLANGKRKDAIHAAKEAEGFVDDNENLCAGLIQLFAKMGRYDKVLTYWWKAQHSGWSLSALPQTLAIACMQFLATENRDSELLAFLRQMRKVQEPNETVLLNLAVRAESHGCKDEALQAYTEVLRLNPMNLIAAQKRAELLTKMGSEYDALSPSALFYGGFQDWIVSLYISFASVAKKDLAIAADHFLAAIRTCPDPQVPTYATIKELVGVADDLGLRSVLENRLGVNTGHVPEQPAELHFAAFLTHDDRKQLEWLRSGHALAIDRPMLTCDLAMAEVFAGDKQNAITLARQVVKSTAPAPPSAALAYAGRILLLVDAPPEETLAIADDALQQAPHDASSLWIAQHVRAESLNSLGRFEDALSAGILALGLHKAPLTVMAVLRSLQGLGRSSEALELAEKACGDFPDDVELKSWKALLLNLEGRDKECIALVRSMGATGAILVTPLLNMADCLLRGKRYSQALTCYRSARNNLERAHKSGMLEEFYIRAVSGEVNTLIAQAKRHAALRVFNALGDDYLVSTPLWLLKANLCIELKRFADGLSLIDARAKIEPTDPAVSFHRAWFLWRQGKAGDALASADETVTLAGKETPLSLDLRARILADLSRFEEAINLLLRKMELQAALKETVNLGAAMLAAEWLPKCSQLPLIGLQMSAVWLGAICLQRGRSANVKKIFKTLTALDWSQVRHSAKEGNRESLLSLAIVQKARHHLGYRSAVSPRRMHGQVTPLEHGSTVLDSLLCHLLHADWPKRLEHPKKPKKARQRKHK